MYRHHDSFDRRAAAVVVDCQVHHTLVRPDHTDRQNLCVCVRMCVVQSPETSPRLARRQACRYEDLLKPQAVQP